MLIVLSPSKRLNYDPAETGFRDTPEFAAKAIQLTGILKKFSVPELMNLMNINEDLASLNLSRYKAFSKEFTNDNAKAAILAFTGDVYLGLDASTLSQKQMDFAQDHLRILSGLYGILRPLDAMQPYRLEMGTSLPNRKGKNLYEFWGGEITKSLNRALKSLDSGLLVNLASKEYFSTINLKKLKAEVLEITFREYRDGKLKFLSFNAKKARGFMSRYIIQNQITSKEAIKGFNSENYHFDEALSSETNYMFVR